MKKIRGDTEDRLDKTRVKLYNEMRGMSTIERCDYVNNKADLILKKYGLKTISLTEPRSTVYDTNQTHSATMVMDGEAEYITKNKK